MANSSNDTGTSRQLIIRVPMELHRAIRIRVAEEDTTIQQWVLTLIERELERGQEKPTGRKRSGDSKR